MPKITNINLHIILSIFIMIEFYLLKTNYNIRIMLAQIKRIINLIGKINIPKIYSNKDFSIHMGKNGFNPVAGSENFLNFSIYKL